MEKPAPKKELYIEVFAHGLIAIYVESDGAREWIEKEAPCYGTLHTYSYKPDFFHLSPRPTYDTQEVVAYLESYIKEEN